MRNRILPLALLALAASTAIGPAISATPRPDAVVLREGAIARSQLVAVGRDLVVEGDARGDAAALDGSVRVTGRVGGDVIALGGGVLLGETAFVAGDVFALGGSVEAAPGARVEGRTVAHPDFGAAWLTLLEGPTLGLSPFSSQVLAVKLALVTAWLVLVLAFFSMAGPAVLSTSRSVAEEPLRNVLLGLTVTLLLVLAGLLFAAFAAALVGMPLVALVVLAALALKLWGMVAVFHALGERLLRVVFRGRGRAPSALDAAVAGLVVLGALKLVPGVGDWVWTAATLLGVGASLATKFGRREPWFLPAVAQPRA
ncbi:MAG TPA: polymer-forming cytoskeletal protein [Thermoanaerobaculia bacterium]|nr:polymer-forming cytoskeletal protein [Thermoanaerobaculia bacterium]